MKLIDLTQGKKALVDEGYFELLSKYKWFYIKDKRGRLGYAKTRINRKQILMHNLILVPKNGYEIDHINGDGLDNRNINLRYCTHQENTRNRAIGINNTSGYKGITWLKKPKKWSARVWIGGTQVYLGIFSNLKDAISMRNEAESKYYGEYRKLSI